MAFPLVLLLITYLVQYPSLAAWELWLYLSCSVVFLESNTMEYCWNVAGLNIYRIRAQMNDFTYYVIYNGSNRSTRMFYLVSFIFSHCHHYHSRPHCLLTVLLQWTSNWNQLSVFLHHWIFHTSARFIFLYYWNCSPSSNNMLKSKSLHNLMMPFYLNLTSAVSHIPSNQSKFFCNPLSLVHCHFPTFPFLLISFSTYYKCYSTSFTSLQLSLWWYQPIFISIISDFS